MRFDIPCGGRFEALCWRVGPRFHRWVYSTWCGVQGEWWDAIRWRLRRR